MIADLVRMARRARVVEQAIGRTTMYPCSRMPTWLDDEARILGHLDANGDRLVAFETPRGDFVAMVHPEGGTARWYEGEITAKRWTEAERDVKRQDAR